MWLLAMAVDVFDLRHDLKGSDVKKGIWSRECLQEKSKAEQHNNLKCSVAWSRVDFSVCWLRRTKLTTLDWWVRSYRGSVASYFHTFSRTRLLSWLSEFFAMKKDTKTYKVLILLHTFTTIVAQAFCIT